MSYGGEGTTLYPVRRPPGGKAAAERYDRQRRWQRIAYFSLAITTAALLVGSLLITWLGEWS